MPWPKGKKVPQAVLEKRNQAISEAMRRRFLKQVEEQQDAPKPTKKRCSGCGKTRPLNAFHLRRTKLKSGLISVTPQGRCKECFSKRSKAKYAALKADPERYAKFRADLETRRDPEKKRKWNREFETTKRREQGIPPRNFSKPKPLNHDHRVPIAPIKALIVEKAESIGPHTLAHRAAKVAGTSTDSAERRLNMIRSGEQDCITLRWADAFLTSLNCQALLPVFYPVEPQPYTYLPG